VARGPHLEAIKRNGLLIRSHKGDFASRLAAIDDPSGLGKLHVVLTAVKS
jgi:2-dehydropantoate 2-reductase